MGGGRGSINWWGEVCSDCMNVWHLGVNIWPFWLLGYRLQIMHALRDGKTTKGRYDLSFYIADCKPGGCKKLIRDRFWVRVGLWDTSSGPGRHYGGASLPSPDLFHHQRVSLLFSR